VVQRGGSFVFVRIKAVQFASTIQHKEPRLITWSDNIQQRKTTAIATLVGYTMLLLFLAS
jgi:preprotein translocase subunit SecY